MFVSNTITHNSDKVSEYDILYCIQYIDSIYVCLLQIQLPLTRTKFPSMTFCTPYSIVTTRMRICITILRLLLTMASSMTFSFFSAMALETTIVSRNQNENNGKFRQTVMRENDYSFCESNSSLISYSLGAMLFSVSVYRFSEGAWCA